MTITVNSLISALFFTLVKADTMVPSPVAYLRRAAYIALCRRSACVRPFGEDATIYDANRRDSVAKFQFIEGKQRANVAA
jgi:D-alanyl-D-alanine dipeptidase